MDLDPEVKDPYGIPVARMHFEWDENVLKKHRRPPPWRAQKRVNGTDAGPAGTHQATTYLGRLRELAVLFLKLGSISFGGPAAHIALIENEIVHKREWITRQQFLDMVGAANLIPGPTSTETAITVGFVRAGWAGLCVAGASFILPAALITGAFAWMYVRFGSLPQATSVLAGIKPAVLAVIAIAIWRLGKTAVKDCAAWAAGHARFGCVLLRRKSYSDPVRRWAPWHTWRGNLRVLALELLSPPCLERTGSLRRCASPATLLRDQSPLGLSYSGHLLARSDFSFSR